MTSYKHWCVSNYRRLVVQQFVQDGNKESIKAIRIIYSFVMEINRPVNSPGGFPSQRASNTESVSMSLLHRVSRERWSTFTDWLKLEVSCLPVNLPQKPKQFHNQYLKHSGHLSRPALLKKAVFKTEYVSVLPGIDQEVTRIKFYRCENFSDMGDI